MAVSLIAGVTQGTVKIPCILKEGNLTYGAKYHLSDGMHDTGVAIATPINKDDWVILSTDTANTYDATEGNPVVVPIAAGTSVIGQVISEPEWRAAPPTSSQSTWSTMLSSKYYRVATVEWYGLSGVAKAVLVGASTGNVTPGDTTTLKIDASASIALAAALAPNTLSVYDVASGGTLLAMHYVASGSATVNIMVGFLGGTVVITA
jgi:hypothetical protein